MPTSILRGFSRSSKRGWHQEPIKDLTCLDLSSQKSSLQCATSVRAKQHSKDVYIPCSSIEMDGLGPIPLPHPIICPIFSARSLELPRIHLLSLVKSARLMNFNSLTSLPSLLWKFKCRVGSVDKSKGLLYCTAASGTCTRSPWQSNRSLELTTKPAKEQENSSVEWSSSFILESFLGLIHSNPALSSCLEQLV